METSIQKLIDITDYAGLRKMLSNDPHLANEGLPFNEVNTTKAHPLHRICDGVYSKKYTDEEAVKIAVIFLEFGAHVNGWKLIVTQDTPLLAAASLHADRVALLYLDSGAIIHHQGCHGGTALHWAAWCGRDIVVKRLLEEGAETNKKCIDFKATPLFWAIHGLKNGGDINLHHQVECVPLLIQAGADINIPNIEGTSVFDLFDEEDEEIRTLLR